MPARGRAGSSAAVAALAAALLLLAAGARRVVPRLPLQFVATATAESHLVDKAAEYPPWRTVYDLAFDFEAKRVAATVLEGFDAGSTFIRHYDRRWEYRVTSGEFSDCRRAFLSEDLPEPELPSSLELVNGDGEWEGRPASEWRTESDHARVTVWQDAASGLPVAVTDEGFNGTAMVPLMTHRLESVTVGAPPPGRMDLPPPWRHADCEPYAGGWPWIHFFDVYLMG
ncbi:hypothetical protein FNF31_04970 [Cafeteria roenbergensis]|uniref:Uncharacterized protein n=1 Tax=Cafeteria roenbergensis TaxID=33653 RepID=A0A5A8D5M2_CAFRO|nr:hypothetical protein FNF31_04970 [Cafeteria roenbergensis]